VHQKRPRDRREGGNSTLEYVGAVGLAAIPVLSLLGVWFHSGAIKIMTTAYCKVSSAVGLGLQQILAPRSSLPPAGTLTTSLRSCSTTPPTRMRRTAARATLRRRRPA
jgi:hypothetical protein